MGRKRKTGAVTQHFGVQGFCRLQVCEYGPNGEPNYRIVSDTGYQGPNQITNIGFLNYINYALGGSASSLIVGSAAVGTGSTPASSGGSLPGETNVRKATTYSAPSSTQAQWIASWDSSLNPTSCTIGNAGLYYAHSSVQSLFCGKSVTGQTWATNQSLNLTYQLNLSGSAA